MVGCNSTPLIAFARIGELELRRRIVGHVVISDAVWDEITEARNRAGADESLNSIPWIEGGGMISLLDPNAFSDTRAAAFEGRRERSLDRCDGISRGRHSGDPR
jgi:hypothetical protein